jgi:hypothetical protein
MDNSAQSAFDYLVGQGRFPVQAAGIAGNLQGESGQGLDPLAISRGDGRDGSDSIGVAQWNGARAEALQDHAASGLAGTATKNAATALANALFRKDPAESYAEAARILSAQGPDARAFLDALAGTLNRQSAAAPRLNRLGDRAALAAAIVGGRYLRQLAGTPSSK